MPGWFKGPWTEGTGNPPAVERSICVLLVKVRVKGKSELCPLEASSCSYKGAERGLYWSPAIHCVRNDLLRVLVAHT